MSNLKKNFIKKLNVSRVYTKQCTCIIMVDISKKDLLTKEGPLRCLLIKLKKVLLLQEKKVLDLPDL